jgi:hypothetical protein
MLFVKASIGGDNTAAVLLVEGPEALAFVLRNGSLI